MMRAKPTSSSSCAAGRYDDESRDASERFEAMHTDWYGRHLFFLPGLLILLVTTLALSCLVFTGLVHFGYLSCNPLLRLPDTALSAFAGAYMWVVNDFISRARRLDFSPADVHWGTLRLVIAIPMGYAFANMLPNFGLTVAFALGAFPLDTLTSILRRLLYNWSQLKPTEDEAASDISKLQGVNREVVERLAKEDITSVVELAYCDPVRLTMRSNLSFNFVTDCMGQALAWMYLEDKLKEVRPMGLRGAIEISHLHEEMPGGGLALRSDASTIVDQAAKKIGQDPETLRNTLEEIALDPFTSFLNSVWSLPEGDLDKSEPASGQLDLFKADATACRCPEACGCRREPSDWDGRIWNISPVLVLLFLALSVCGLAKLILVLSGGCPGCARAAPLPTTSPPSPPPPPEAPPAPVNIDLQSDVLFPFASPRLTPAGEQALKGLADTLAAKQVVSMAVIGHADRITRDPARNQALSERRARAVADYLIDHAPGLPEPVVRGLGASEPKLPPGACDAHESEQELRACLAPDRSVVLRYWIAGIN